MDRLLDRAPLCPSPPPPPLQTYTKKKKEKKERKTNHTERLVGRTEPRVKGERKGLFCVPSVNLVLKDTQTHVHKATHKHTLTHTHTYARTHTRICSKVALTSRSVLGQPENGAQRSACFTTSRSRCGDTGRPPSLCSSKLYKD